MAPIGTEVDFNSDQNFEFIQNGSIDNKNNLKISIELGYLVIPPRNISMSFSSNQAANNIYFPPPGGKQGQSFVSSNTLKGNKSNTLTPVTNGLMPPHIDITGGPYCTFVAGTLEPGVHPYYDLIQGPPDAPVYHTSGTATYNSGQPVITKQVFQANESKETQQFNKVGSVFIPSTDKTSDAVKSLALPAITSYNIWNIDNLGGGVNGSQYFNFIKYLGWVPASNANFDKIQPYAQTWSFSDTAQIQVYASNSQVTLSRLYPLSKDMAHDKNGKYIIFNNASNGINSSSSLQVNPIGLSYNPTPVGFVIKFSSIVVNNTIPVGAPNNPTVLTEPRLIITWGDLTATTEQLNTQYTSKNLIGRYTLEISPNKPPRIFFNISGASIANVNVGANDSSVELTNLKQILSSDKNSGSKTPNDYELYVYYSGPFLKIGNNKDPGSWQVIGNQKIQVKNASGYVPVDVHHYLDATSGIKIDAQFMNFVFSYGPPLFSPHDDQNIPALTSTNPNTLNFINGQGPSDDGVATKDKEKKINQFIIDNSAQTFQQYNSNNFMGGASAYHDIRSSIGQSGSTSSYNVSLNLIDPSNQLSGYTYKVTMPQDLGGHVFCKFMPDDVPEPDITDSYAKYDLKFKTTSDTTPSEVLSQALSALTLSEGADSSTTTYISQDLSATFLNLNRSDLGLSVLQFIRQNVVVIRVSAGYSALYPYFEGMVTDVEVSESLELTSISIKAVDLMTALFSGEGDNKRTLIVSRQRMIFVGQKFFKTINALVYMTELYNHFKYDLGDSTDPTTIAYWLRNDPNAKLPPAVDTAVSPSLSTLVVGSYDENNTYFQVLKTICTMSLQTKNQKNTQSKNDVPILYWNTFGFGDEISDGIVMSSRTTPVKDIDIFYIRKGQISTEMLTDIESLHGYLAGIDAPFQSNSSSTNLMAFGIFRYLDEGKNYSDIIIPNTSAFTPIDFIEDAQSYIGYNKIVSFNKTTADKGYETVFDNNLLPSESIARDLITRWMNTAYFSVYESILLKSYVTKPLKKWGSFQVCVEDDTNIIDELYYYSKIEYNFDIANNLIIATINASRKPIAGL